MLIFRIRILEFFRAAAVISSENKTFVVLFQNFFLKLKILIFFSRNVIRRVFNFMDSTGSAAGRIPSCGIGACAVRRKNSKIPRLLTL